MKLSPCEGKMGRWDNVCIMQHNVCIMQPNVCIMQPDRKKGKSDGNHVWTDEVSVIVQVYIGKNDKC